MSIPLIITVSFVTGLMVGGGLGIWLALWGSKDQ